jgi:hypothetical protein
MKADAPCPICRQQWTEHGPDEFNLHFDVAEDMERIKVRIAFRELRAEAERPARWILDRLERWLRATPS